MIGFYDYTVIATYLATVLGVGGIFLAADGLHLPAGFPGVRLRQDPGRAFAH